MKQRVKRSAPWLVRGIRRAQAQVASVGLAQRVVRRRRSLRETFGGIYHAPTSPWGSVESRSGAGSTLRVTANLRELLPGLIAERGIRSVLDAPCGDFNWMQHVELGVDQYIGADIVPDMIEANQSRFGSKTRRFLVADLSADELPRADLVICRDLLIHLSFEDGVAVLANIKRSGAEWLLVSTASFVESNRDTFSGAYWRDVNLQLSPYALPAPVAEYVESKIALWRVSDLPAGVGG